MVNFILDIIFFSSGDNISEGDGDKITEILLTGLVSTAVAVITVGLTMGWQKRVENKKEDARLSDLRLLWFFTILDTCVIVLKNN